MIVIIESVKKDFSFQVCLHFIIYVFFASKDIEKKIPNSLQIVNDN